MGDPNETPPYHSSVPPPLRQPAVPPPSSTGCGRQRRRSTSSIAILTQTRSPPLRDRTSRRARRARACGLGPDLAASAAVRTNSQCRHRVLGAPMYNSPSRVSSRPGSTASWWWGTFKYDANGRRSLAGSKRVIVAISRGGHYGAGAPGRARRASRNLSALGVRLHRITTPSSSSPMASVGPEHREKALANALQAATSLQAA